MDEVFGVVEEVVHAACGGGVGGEVVEGVGVRAGPVTGGVAAVGDAVSEGVDERAMDGCGVSVVAEVFGEGLVVEAVGRAAVLGGFDDVGASVAA